MGPPDSGVAVVVTHRFTSLASSHALHHHLVGVVGRAGLASAARSVDHPPHAAPAPPPPSRRVPGPPASVSEKLGAGLPRRGPGPASIPARDRRAAGGTAP